MTVRAWCVVTTLVLGAGCRDAESAHPRVSRAPMADGVATGYSTEGATWVATIVGLHDPESVLHDPAQDVYFVSNVDGFGSNKDGRAYVARIPARWPGSGERFVEGGRNGVTLHAPKGLALQGDTLWVTDIDVVRGFHRVTGQPLRVIDFAPLRPVQLNDIGVAPDGTMRVTDTGIMMVYEGNIPVGGDRVFEIPPEGSPRVVADSSALKRPNGITWDSTGNRWVAISFDRFGGHVMNLSASSMLRRGSGQLDGIEALADGALLFSSWADSSIHLLRGDRDIRLIREVPEPADIGLDRRRNHVLIPLTVLGQVQIWSLGRGLP